MIDDVTKQTIQQVASAGSKEEEAVEKRQLVVFELDKEEYAAAISDLREIIKMREITPIPGTPGFVAGIVNVRGQIVVVIDLEKRFLLKRDKATTPLHIIIVEVEKNVFGIIVDEVTGVLRVPVDSIKPTPAMVTSKISADYVKGVIVLDEDTVQGSEKQARLLLLLDIPRMLSEKELQQFSKVIQETTKEKPATGSTSPAINEIKKPLLKQKSDETISDMAKSVKSQLDTDEESESKDQSSLETTTVLESEVKTPKDKGPWQSVKEKLNQWNHTQSPLAQKTL